MLWAHGIEDTNTQVDVYNYLFNPSIMRNLIQRTLLKGNLVDEERMLKKGCQKDSVTIETTINININETLN